MPAPSSETIRHPAPLTSGARVALVAPAGPLRDSSELERAIENARSLGWEPVPSKHVLARRRYLAGSDAERADDLNRAFRDAHIDGVWCVRGGYGAMRLLDRLDYDALSRHSKALLGYSDVSSLHAAVRARCRLVTYHAPTARSDLTPFTRASLTRAVQGEGEPCGHAPNAKTLRGGIARGPLIGGNLAVLTALVGTPYALDTTDAILVLEDVKESVYRIDRLLHQLRMSGAIGRVRGLIFGSFTERPDEDDNDDDALDAVMAEATEWIEGPVLSGVPIGHLDDQWTFPLGAMAELDADAKTLRTVALAPTLARHAQPERMKERT